MLDIWYPAPPISIDDVSGTELHEVAGFCDPRVNTRFAAPSFRGGDELAPKFCRCARLAPLACEDEERGSTSRRRAFLDGELDDEVVGSKRNREGAAPLPPVPTDVQNAGDVTGDDVAASMLLLLVLLPPMLLLPMLLLPMLLPPMLLPMLLLPILLLSMLLLPMLLPPVLLLPLLLAELCGTTPFDAAFFGALLLRGAFGFFFFDLVFVPFFVCFFFCDACFFFFFFFDFDFCDAFLFRAVSLIGVCMILLTLVVDRVSLVPPSERFPL